MTGREFLFDENLSRHLVRLVTVFDRGGSVCVAMADRFHAGVKDEDWIRQASAQAPRPIVISGDCRIFKNKAQRQVLHGNPLTVVFLAEGWTKLPWEEQAPRFLAAWPKVRETTTNPHAALGLYELSINGRKLDSLGPP